MSRYVDLDGHTWDGTKITSKIQEVQTKHGYLQGITVGWLWGDNVPHIDLEEHDKQIRAEAIDEYMNKLCDKCIQQPNECWNLECPFAADECQIIKIAEQLKEQNNTYTAKVDGVKREFM